MEQYFLVMEVGTAAESQINNNICSLVFHQRKDKIKSAATYRNQNITSYSCVYNSKRYLSCILETVEQ